MDKFKVVVTDRVRFVETDLMGVVHHSNYLRWFEMGRVEYLRQVGIDLNQLVSNGILFPIVEISCRYKQSAHFDDMFAIHCWLEEFHRAKLQFLYEVRRLEDDALLATGETVNVFTDLQGKIIRLSDEHYALLGQNPSDI